MTRNLAILYLISALFIPSTALQAQQHFTIEQVLAPAFPYDLTAAKKADRLVWIGNEQGKRNVYTAVGPDYKPLPITAFNQDDGIDLQNLQVAGDGTTVAFIRGHSKNRNGWVASDGSAPVATK